MYDRLKSWAVALTLSSLFCVIVAQETPSISYITPEQIKNVGDTVELKCSVQHAEDYGMLWVKTNQNNSGVVFLSSGSTLMVDDYRFTVHYDQSTSSYILRIKDIQETDTGIYQCALVLSSSRSIKAYVELWVRRPAIISDYPKHYLDPAEGEAVVMSCSALGSPTPQITWHRDDNATLPTGGVIYTGNVLQINWVRKEDRGTYYCVADNGVGKSDKRAIDLKVKYSPEITVPQRRLAQALSYDTELQCHIEAYPLPAIVWMKDGMDLSNDQNYSISVFERDDGLIITTLRIVYIEKFQYGEYFCQATNKIGQNKAKVELYETDFPVCPPACGSYDFGAARTISVSSFLLMATILAVLL